MIRKIQLFGYYGFQNTGDDALLSATLHKINSMCPSATLFVHGPSPITLPIDRRKVHFLPPKQKFRGHYKFLRYWNAIQSDWIVVGGGSLLNDSSGRRFQQEILSHFRVGKLSRTRLAILSVGVGPFLSRGGEKDFKKIAEITDALTVRDQCSADLVESITGCRPIVVGDLALTLADNSFPETHIPCRITSRKGRKTIGVSVCYFHRYFSGNYKPDNIREEKIVAALRKVIETFDVDIALFVFNGNSIFGEQILIERIKQKLLDIHDCKITVLPYCPEPRVVLNEIKKCDMILGMRLHSSIFAFMAKKPQIILAYHPKSREFAKQVGIPNDCLFSSETFLSSDLANQIIQVIANPNKFSPSVALDKMVCESEKNFSILASYFGSTQKSSC